MDLNNFLISVNRITHNLFFCSRVKVKRSELGLVEIDTLPTSNRDRREALKLPDTTTPRDRVPFRNHMGRSTPRRGNIPNGYHRGLAQD